jgi:hypothetical protein
MMATKKPAGLISNPPSNAYIRELRQSEQYQKLKRLVGFYAVGDIQTAQTIGMGDLLADLRHVCDEFGVDWTEADEMGRQSYEQERRK